jgi:quinol monooxygenase YgiN
MAAIWTHATYRVKSGCVDDFVQQWDELARHAVEEFGVRPPTMLRDRDDPNVLVTFGPWGSLDTLQLFRSSPLVRERTPVLDELVEAAEADIFDEVLLGG